MTNTSKPPGLVEWINKWLFERFGVPGLVVLALPEQPADFRQLFVGVGPIVIGWRAGPERFLVQDDAVLRDAAENHHSEPTIAERQRLSELAGRCFVPHDQRAVTGRLCR